MEALIPYLIVLLKCLGAVICAVFLGNGAVYFFNKMPARWFTEYGKEPEGDLADPYHQRIRSHPWKIVFTIGFVILGILLAVDDLRFALPALCTIWLLLEMSIGDVKYHIVPDQLIILTAITALGYIPYMDGWLYSVTGMAVGIGFMGMTALLGWLIYRRPAMGGGDVKLMGALGFILGPLGTLLVIILATLVAAIHYTVLTFRKKIRKGQELAMVPYIALASTAYLAFLWGLPEVLLSL